MENFQSITCQRSIYTLIMNRSLRDYTRRARVAPLGLLCGKTFKSLRSETSDQRHMDLIVFKTVKNTILRDFLRTNYVLFFAQNQMLQLVWFGNIPVTFKENPRFFWDPLFVPFLLNLSFEDPLKSSMNFYRKDLTAKIMLRTHMKSYPNNSTSPTKKSKLV